MYGSTFAIVALIMRYVFALIIILITIKIFKITLKDMSITIKAKQKGSTTVGWLEIIEPEDDEYYFGKIFPLKRENNIGSSINSNVYIKIKGVHNNHAIISQRDNKVILSKYSALRKIYVNGEKIRKNIELLDGDEIAIGECLIGFYLSDDEEE